jgi:hypothetical protein
VATGDYDGDGYADLVLGCPNSDSGTGVTDVGIVFVILGGSSFEGISEDEISMNKHASFSGGEESAFAGQSLATLADIDDDDADELLVGAPSDGSIDGKVYLALSSLGTGNHDLTTEALPFTGTDLGNLGRGLTSVGNVNGYTETDGEPIGQGPDFLISTVTDASTPKATVYLMLWGP